MKKNLSDPGGTEIPTGGVQFFVDGSPYRAPMTVDGTGAAVLDDANLPVGTHAITASYQPLDDKFSASESQAAASLVVTPAQTSTSIDLEPATTLVGQGVTFRAGVANTSDGSTAVPTGEVQFGIDGTPYGPSVPLDGDGYAFTEDATLPFGTHEITADYLPADDNFDAGDQASATQSIVAIGTVLSTLSGVSGSGTFGGTGTLTATLTSQGLPMPDSAVSFTLNKGGTIFSAGTATTNINGVATIGVVSVIGLAAGTNEGVVAASFAGDLTHPKTSSSGDVVISSTQNPSPVFAPIRAQSAVQGSTVTVTASASETNAGATLTYILGAGAPAGSTINANNGIFTWSVPASQATGQVSVTINVIDNSHPPLSDTTTFTIDVEQATTLSAVSGRATDGGTITLSASLTAQGSPVVGKPLTFTLNEGGTVTPVGMATTNASGVATLTGVSLAGFPDGVLDGAVGVRFVGDPTDAGMSASGNLTVSPPSDNMYTVNSLGDTGEGSGLSGDLRYVIAQANSNPGSVINFSVSGTIQLTAALPDLARDVTLNGPGASSLSIAGIPGETIRSFSVLKVDAGVTASVSGVSITGNYDQFYGALYNAGSLTLTNCTLSGNTSGERSGAIDNTGTMTVAGCTVSNNVSGSGGGGIENSGTMTVTDSIITANSAASGGRGGGLYNMGGTLTLIDSTVLGNSADAGGGIFNSGGMLTVTGSAISGNSGLQGGGLDNATTGSVASLTDCTISGNSVRADGGAIENQYSVTLTGCTLSKNTAGSTGTSGGGAIYNIGNGSAGSGTMLLTNCTLADNSVNDGLGGAILNKANDDSNRQHASPGNSATGQGRGGGIANYDHMTLTDCTVSGNSASSGGGGGIASLGFTGSNGIPFSSYLTISGSTISGNTAQNSAGIEGFDCFLTLTSDTVTANMATEPSGGGGLTLEISGDGEYGGVPFTDALLNNTIIAGNTSGASPGASADDGNGAVDAASSFNLIGDGDGFFGITAGSQGNLIGSDLAGTVIDARLGPLADNGGPTETVALLPGSPALGAGANGADIGETGSETVTGSTAVFHALAAPSITYGAAMATVSGQIAAGTLIPTGSVSITLNGVTQLASIDQASGNFSAVFTTSTLSVAASPYSISYSYSGNTSFASASSDSTLTVNKAALTVMASNASKTYGSANPGFAASDSAFVNGDTPAVLGGTLNFTTTATSASHDGSYAVTPGGLTATNYAITFVPGILTVTPAPLTVSADNETRSAGQPNPPLTATYVGLINGDTAASFATPAVLSTTATTDSAAGSYPISVGGATSLDYTITFLPGTLTVLPASMPPTTFNALAAPTISYGSTPQPPSRGRSAAGAAHFLPGGVTITLDGVTATAAIDSTSGAFSSVFTTSTLGVAESPYTISYSYSGNTSFASASSDSARLTFIQGHPDSTTANDASKTYR